MQAVLILGRQPELGLTEAEVLFGAAAVRPVIPPGGARDGPPEPIAALLTADPSDVHFSRLGGSLKLGTVLARLNTANWGDTEYYLKKNLSRLLPAPADGGKLKLGISVYGLRVRIDRLNATGLTLKKAIKATGQSVRIVPNKALELNAAQVLHNRLTGAGPNSGPSSGQTSGVNSGPSSALDSGLGCELLLIADGTSTIIARTVAVQDIDAYTKRDHGRPMRDAKVGMLPPKLAQVMINLARKSPSPVSNGTVPENAVLDAAPAKAAGVGQQTRLLDPFCGTGVVLQEAALMGYAVYGTDLEERMIRYTRDNLNWLQATHRISFDWFVEVADATIHTWQKPVNLVVAETYLGRPLASLPDPATLEKIIRYCDDLHRKFFKNLSAQLEPGTRLCLAVPAWQLRPGVFKHLTVLDQMGNLGYNRVSFVHVGTRDLMYARPDQVVARELVILEKQ